MKLPFLDFFKKSRGLSSATAVAPKHVAPPLEKPASERLGKTVMPNVSRAVGLEPGRNVSVPGPAPVAASVAVPVPALPSPGASPTISLGGNATPASAPKVGAQPNGLSPGEERTIAWQLVDLVPQIPRELLQTVEIDPHHCLLFKASEIERGMANGRPTVPLRAIYQQVPELFTTEVSASDPRQIMLPFSKVLEQFASLQVRSDQVRDQAVPQVETPFLKVTIEDGERFGTPPPTLHTTELPAVAVQPATAETIAAAEPEPAAKIQPIDPIRLAIPKETNEAAAGSSPETPIRLDQLPARPPISPKISPNGTGVSATERVPASSGPPVPIPLSASFAPPPPARTPFKIGPPSNDLRRGTLAPEKSAAAVGAKPLKFSEGGLRIELPLRAVLRGIPPFQLSGRIEDVPETAKIELPFSIVQPQLSLGRVSISPLQFQAALPREHRNLFILDEGGLPVALPLQEVLQNMPNESLQLRSDQEEVEIGEMFETPFSQKAAEDAARMKVTVGPIAKSSLPEIISFAAEPELGPEEKAAVPPRVVAPAVATAPAARTALQAVLDTDETLDAKAVVAHASRLPGVLACAIIFSDGLSLAGNIPADYEADALCAMAPSIVKRIDDQMMSANLGTLNGITLFCAKAPVSFFAHGNICLAALHSAGEMAAEIRDRLSRAAQELSRMYAQPA
jgi:predicted regulator of Ras-like GTPase activity (Roadblock/LC7/MglB family)